MLRLGSVEHAPSVGKCMKLRGWAKEDRVVRGQEGQREICGGEPGPLCLVCPYLFVTSIWMMKLDTKTKKAQAV